MKSFNPLSEVAQPKPEEEKRFKDQHKIDVGPHPHAGDEVFKGTKSEKPKAKRKADQEGDANYDVAYNESVEQIDEISKKTLGSYVKKASYDAASNAAKFGANQPDKKGGSAFVKAHNRLRGIAKATDRLTKEEVEELDEISRDTARSYIRKASADNAERKKEVMKPFPMKDMGKNVEMHKKFKKREAGIEMAGKKAYGIGGKAKVNATESVEQLDELSPNTLHSYIKKAAGNMAGNAAVAAAQASSSMKKSSPDVKRKIRNRMQGITGASGRLADKANMAENWQEEIPMIMRQLEFIVYAAEEIMDYVEMAGDPEEWFQNKISGIHSSMLSMYAYAQGGRRAGYGFDESVEEELKGGQKKLDHNKNGKIDAHDFHLMRKKKMKEEVEILHEAFKQGVVKLKDGGSVVLKKEDADLLNQMFKDLSAGNRKKMQEVAMKDKAGFEEILGFAREAL